MMAGPPAALVLAALLAASIAGCGGPPKKQTPAEWLDENTYILDQLRSYQKGELHEGINRFLKLGKERGTEVVNFILNDPGLQRKNDYRLEVVLARILAEWKDGRAIPTLLRNLQGTDSGALAIVKEGLIIYGDDPRILEAMKELLGDPELELRRTGAEVLSEMKGPEAVKLLSDHRKTEEDLTIRGLCVMGVLSSRDPRRLAYLVDCLEDGDAGIRREAWLAIDRRKPPVRFDPRGDAASRARAVAELRTWVKAGAKTAAGGGEATAGAVPPGTRSKP